MSKATTMAGGLAGQSTAELVRPIGAFERLFFRHAVRNPMHFVVVAEFDTQLNIDLLQQSVRNVQRRHALLSVHLEDRPGTRLGFYRSKTVAPIEIAIRECEDADWTPLVSSELAHPFDRSRAPLMRAVVAHGSNGSNLALTFDHTVADGISSLIVLNDLVASMSGLPLEDLPVPASQEELIDRELSGVVAFDDSELPVADARMSRPASLRPFDDEPTRAQVCELDEMDTAQLVHRSRAEHTTVHASIVTAASRVRGEDLAEPFVRVESPINFRSQIGVVNNCADYFAASCTGMAPREDAFWNQARGVTSQLAAVRSLRGIVTASKRVRQAIPVDADVVDAERLFTRVLPHDLLISNLGVHQILPTATIRPTAIYGPFVQGHLEGEHILGVVTYEGRLRMSACGYNLKPGFLERVSRVVINACEYE
jgi:hypothetical protein